MLERIANRLLAIRLGHAFQRLAAGGGAYRKNFAQQRMGLRGEMQQPDAPVLGMGAPLDELRLFQPVEDARQGDRLDFEDLGQAALLDALVARQMRQHRHCERVSPSPRAFCSKRLRIRRATSCSRKPKLRSGSSIMLLLSMPNVSLLIIFSRSCSLCLRKSPKLLLLIHYFPVAETPGVATENYIIGSYGAHLFRAQQGGPVRAAAGLYHQAFRARRRRRSRRAGSPW